MVLSSGIRHLAPSHILHHLNRWAKHVWRPAVPARVLASLTRTPSRDNLQTLGAGAVSLLSAVLDAVRRCAVTQWLSVLGVLFLADDPWSVEVGHIGSAVDVDRAATAMCTLFDERDLLSDVTAALALQARDAESRAAAPFDLDAAGTTPPTSTSWGHGREDTREESFAELRCRVAALQLQMDDVTAVVRRNERITNDLLSSFHFWSLLLLDELRGYRASAPVPTPVPSAMTKAQTTPLQTGSLPGHTGVLDSLSVRLGRIGIPPTAGVAAVPTTSTAGGLSRRVATPPGKSAGTGNGPNTAAARELFGKAEGSKERLVDGRGSQGKGERRKPRRVFRDGKWVEL